MPVFRVFFDLGIYFSENAQNERQEKLNSYDFSDSPILYEYNNFNMYCSYLLFFVTLPQTKCNTI